MNKLLIAGIILTLSAPATHAQQPQDGAFGSPFRFTETTGAAIYQNICAGCHMPNGQGASGAGAYPSLANDPRLAAPAYPIALVLRGNKAMPAFGRFLTDQQVADVVDYITHNLDNNNPGHVTADDVHTLR
jgi:mono/diheme cytochrome c family protein